MTLKMTHAMRMQLADAIRDRYAAAATKDKSRTLEEFIAATGYHEKSAIRVLNASPEPKRRSRRSSAPRPTRRRTASSRANAQAIAAHRTPSMSAPVALPQAECYRP